jgi:hypothetical protein
MEPSMKLFYHGLEVKKVGGCNFERFKHHINLTHDYISNNYTPPKGTNAQYEQPYYNWEAELRERHGNDPDAESTGSYLSTGFRGLITISQIPDEKFKLHPIMKK